MNGARSTHVGRREVRTKYYLDNLKEEGFLEVLWFTWCSVLERTLKG